MANCAHTMGIRKKMVMQNLKIAFPEESDEWHRRITRETYTSFGRFIGVWFNFNQLGRDKIIDMIHLGNADVVREALNRGKGIVLNTGHFGDWEVLGLILAHHCQEFFTVVHRLRNDYLDRYFEKLHLESNIHTIYKGKSLPKLHAVLEKGQAIGMLSDQSAGGHGIFVPFFSRLTSFHRGPALLALDSGADFIAVFILRQKSGWVVRLERIDSTSTGDSEADTYRIMSAYAGFLEKTIREYPPGWFWFHNRWRAKPPKDFK